MLGNSLGEIVYSLQRQASPIDIPDNDLPDFVYAEDSSRALTWLQEFNRANSDQFDIDGVLSSIGVTVHLEDLGGEISGYIERRHNGWHIGINKFERKGRQRFTLAHELAHLLFHKPIILGQMVDGRFTEAIKLFRSQENSKHIEMEANAFAAELLMPSSKFRELWDTDLSLQEVSDNFGVSRYAAEFRAKKLRLSGAKA